MSRVRDRCLPGCRVLSTKSFDTRNRPSSDGTHPFFLPSHPRNFCHGTVTVSGLVFRYPNLGPLEPARSRQRTPFTFCFGDWRVQRRPHTDLPPTWSGRDSSHVSSKRKVQGPKTCPRSPGPSTHVGGGWGLGRPWVNGGCGYGVGTGVGATPKRPGHLLGNGRRGLPLKKFRCLCLKRHTTHTTTVLFLVVKSLLFRWPQPPSRSVFVGLLSLSLPLDYSRGTSRPDPCSRRSDPGTVTPPLPHRRVGEESGRLATRPPHPDSTGPHRAVPRGGNPVR